MQKILDGHVVFSYWARKIYFYGTFKQKNGQNIDIFM